MFQNFKCKLGAKFGGTLFQNTKCKLGAKIGGNIFFQNSKCKLGAKLGGNIGSEYKVQIGSKNSQKVALKVNLEYQL